MLLKTRNRQIIPRQNRRFGWIIGSLMMRMLTLIGVLIGQLFGTSIEITSGVGNPADCGSDGIKHYLSVVVIKEGERNKMIVSTIIGTNVPIKSSLQIRSRLSSTNLLICNPETQDRCDILESLPLNVWMNRQMLTDIMVGRAELILNRNTLSPCRYLLNPPDSIQAVTVQHFSGEMAGSLKFSFAHHSCAPEVSAEWTGKQKAIPSDLTFTRGMDSCSYRLQEPNGKMRLTEIPVPSQHSNSHGKDPTIKSLSLRLGTGKIVQMVPPK